MVLECRVRVANRNPGGKSGTFYLKSSIALGKETGTENDYFLLHFSNLARGSMKWAKFTKYSLKHNPTKVFTRCMNEGRVTISFGHPAHDLFIQGEVLHLSRFVDTLNACLTGEAGALPLASFEYTEARERYNAQALEKGAMHNATEAMIDETEAMIDRTEAMLDAAEARNDDAAALCSKQLEELHIEI